jgi:hypothetical protein
MFRQDGSLAGIRRAGMAQRPARPVAGRWTRTFKTFLARATAAESPRADRPAARPPAHRAD